MQVLKSLVRSSRGLLIVLGLIHCGQHGSARTAAAMVGAGFVFVSIVICGYLATRTPLNFSGLVTLGFCLMPAFAGVKMFRWANVHRAGDRPEWGEPPV